MSPIVSGWDLEGLRVVVTGASAGVGAALTAQLCARGAEVVRACRSPERAERVAASLPRGARAELVTVDLCDLVSVRAAAAIVARRPIDVLVNNAGVGGARGLSPQGFELAFATNYLGHYLWTRLLWHAVRGRVVHLGSGSYLHALDLDLAAVKRPTRSFTGIPEYAASKLAVMLFHRALWRRAVASAPISVVADPGNVASEAYRHLPAPIRALWMLGMKSPERGAETPLLCAVGRGIVGGAYVDGHPFSVAAHAEDDAQADALWSASARWTGLPEEGVGA